VENRVSEQERTTDVVRGRFVADPPAGTVLFRFGFRVNHWAAVHRWLPVWRAYRRMLRELRASPGAGLLRSEESRREREFTTTQYWRTWDDLMRWSQDRRFAHVGAWKRFNHGVGDTGEVGLWHEMIEISPERLHTIYRDVPERGLAAATGRHEAEAWMMARRRKGEDGRT
jgi:hypothetical protein